jgi:polyphosphate kinase 2 (PPK2 family)
MLELIDLDKQISRDEYDRVFPELERRLGAAQRAARQSGIPVMVVFEGWDSAGKGHLINRMTQVLDPRGFKVHATSAPNEEERRRPWMWRFWRAEPAAGTVAIFDRSWYGRVLVERVEKLTPKRCWQQAYDDILQFERQLVNSGVVIVKFWLQISQREQGNRFRRIAKDPAIAWKTGAAEWRQHRRHTSWTRAVEEMLERTSSAEAPWTVVEATHLRFARTKVFQVLAEAIQRAVQARLAATEPRQPMAQPVDSALERPTLLSRIDLSQSVDRDQYDRELEELQERLFRLEHELYVAQVPAVVVYEGCDAAGKGGNIKRLTLGLDPRGYEVVPIAAPTDEEKARHYLWRFWNHVPKTGHITIFDRSWYGRVLVERVEGFCTQAEWQKAFSEINEFEHQLANFGTVMVKFWLHIDQEEQMRRFQARQQDPARQWKITEEDFRNRQKWPQYERAITEMLQRTSTRYAPWTILEANCKLFARLKALRTVADALEQALRDRIGR